MSVAAVTLAAIEEVAQTGLESADDAVDVRPPEDADTVWLRDTYAGDVPQLTIRAVATGALLGAVLALSNLYVGLKAGWALGVSITACLVSVVGWRALHQLRLTRQPLSLLEQNCMKATASAAAFATCGIMVSAIPAYLLSTGVRIQTGWLMLWTFFLATLGLCLSIPIKRSLINRQGLTFPSGIATAETLRNLHAAGADTLRHARAMFTAMGLGAALQWCTTNSVAWWPIPRIPDPIHLPGRFMGRPLSEYTLGLDGSTVFMAAGALLGVRVSAWMVVGSAIAYLVVAPILLGSGHLASLGFRDVFVTYGLWAGAGLMVAASLTAFLFQLPVVGRALSGLRAIQVRSDTAGDPLADIESPPAWAWIGVTACSVGIIVVGARAFAMPWWVGLITIAFTFVAVLVSCRAMGETDIAPVGNLAKMTQLGAGVLAPGQLSTNLMAGSITATASASAADLLGHQKCSRILGAKARDQVLAQMIGLIVGTLVVVPAFNVLIPSVDRLGTSVFPAPAAQAWRFMAELLGGGIGSLSGVSQVALVVGCAAGVILALAERFVPRTAWVPHPIGLGIGMVIFFSNTLSFLIGAVVATVVRRRTSHDDLITPASSGLIAGESLMGILLAILITLGLMSA